MMTGISLARTAAFQILMAVERGHAHSDDLLRGKALDSLSAPDRNLANALVLGVLRWQLWLDAQVKPLLKHPNAKLDMEIRIALRLGAFQLLLMDRIPARAAIDESVELARQAGHRFASGMVNAVLRKLANMQDSREEYLQNSAAREAHPAWMVERWTSYFGEEAAGAICRHGQSQPALTIRLVGAEAEAELAGAGVQIGPGEMLTASRTVLSGDLTATATFHAGRVRIQDEGSQLVAEIAGRGESILDACAAPGGKTLILAERNPQAHIVACEASPQRFEEFSKRLAGIRDRVECRQADATTLIDEAAYDLALADVPCSGTGTLGRNPEIRHRLLLEDLARQAERQRAILRAALRSVRPGGRVVYSTCSLEPEENEQVVAAVTGEDPAVHVVSLDTRIDALLREGILTAESADRLRGCLTREGMLRLLPGVVQGDGFFIAVIERRA